VLALRQQIVRFDVEDDRDVSVGLARSLAEKVEQLAAESDVLVMQVTDPAERDFPFDQSQTFIDLETGKEQFAVPDNVRETYLENRRLHFDTIRAECLSAEVDLIEFTTDEPLDRALHIFMQQRARSLTTSSKNRRAAGGV